MKDESGEVAQAVWWHTALHLLAAFLMFVPLMLVIGAFLVATGFLSTGDASLGPITRSFQYGLAALGALYVPALLLKRSHRVVTATVFVTVNLTAFILLAVLASASPTGLDLGGLGNVLQVIASIVGIAVGGVFYASSES